MKIAKYIKSPVARWTVGIFFLASLPAWAMDPTDVMLCGVFYPIVILLMAPVLILVRTVCHKCDASVWQRRALMLALVVIVACLVSPSPHKQGRGFLRHGMGQVPAKLEIVDYEGNSGLFVDYCNMSFTCDASSLRGILGGPRFSQVTENPNSTVMGNIQPVGLDHLAGDREDWLYFSSRNCQLVTDASYEWASVRYLAGD